MSNIGVGIYGYQNKNLLKTVSEIIDKSSKKNIFYFYIIDQNNIDRTRSFDQPDFYSSIKYKYVKWDSIKSPIQYKEEAFKSLNKTYYMQIDGDISLGQNWDTHAIDFLKNNPNSIISGNSTVTLKNKNDFFIEPERQESHTFNKINYVDRRFIFTLSETYKKITQPTYLKYYGEEEFVSLDLIDKGISIYNFPDEFILLNEPVIEKEYVPFSLTHNYNKFINQYSNKIKEKFNVTLEPLPFEDDDVIYDINQSQIDKIGGLRYLNKTKEIR